MNNHYRVQQFNFQQASDNNAEFFRLVGYKDEINIMTAWMNSLTLYPDNLDDDKRIKNSFLNSFYLTKP